MTETFLRTWREVVRPMVLRPRAVQVAALCTRDRRDGTEVLLITSRGSGRWILPKGWPVDGKSGPESALQEAWEEAGVKRARIRPEPVGLYFYDKILDSGPPLPVETTVYRVDVDGLVSDYPEAHERKRRWMRPHRAAELVREPHLRQLLQSI